MTKRVLITGATGFVGRQVLRELTKQSISLVAVVRSGKQLSDDLAPFVDKVVHTPDLFQENADWWAEACQFIDTVIHVAWYAEPGKYLQSPINLDCLTGTLNLAKGAAKAGVRRFVGVGTCFEYDLSGGVLSTDTPLNPLTSYAAAKAAAYTALSAWLPSQSVEFSWCRLFYLYGEGEDERRLVPYIRGRLVEAKPAELTSGNQIRDFMDVREAGAAIARVGLGREQGAINICSGIPITVRQLAERIADEYGRRDLLLFGSRPDNLVDPRIVVGVKSQSNQD